MLTNLHVKNLALIDEAEVEFGPGLNILTGETGAGKSILIGSINAALGKKISREMIRTGETSALVELVFETENPHVLELLKETDLGAEEGQVIISRKITGSRSVCRINGEACNISQVKALASLLLDIHGQHEHQSLLYPDRQIAILDAFAGTEAATAKGEVRALYQEWKNVRKELSAYELDEEARKREAAFLTFEINEIDQAELKEGEDEALETAYRKMGHAKKIAESLQTVYAITGYGAENSAGEQVGRAIRELQQAAVYDDALSGPSQTLSDIDGLLNDFNREISAYLSELTFSEEEYYETEKRLDEINRLKAKYGKTMEEILLAGNVALRVVDGVILPHLKMTEQSDRCSFLNEEGRCSIHDARPGFCRMFPLGRLYEDGTFSYFLQVNECPKENKTKVKVRRWLDTPELGKYEAFTTKWHYYLKEKQNAARESEDDAFRQQISMNILKLFYLLPYDGNTDFYTQFAARMELAADKH
jgi:DNA repair exonuclease SbcCD ATPase subunit